MPYSACRPSASASAPLFAVVGGGITGLSTAYFLRRQRPDANVVLFESRPRFGGNIRTEREAGFLFDAGPDSFVRSKPWALDLCKELGLESELVAPNSDGRAVYVARLGQLEKVPEGMVLGAPTRVRPLLDASFISLPGKLRMLTELLLPAGFGRDTSAAARDESIASFVARRFGAEAAHRLGASLLAGIYAGSADELSVRATFPHLLELESRHGSVIRGLIRAQLLPSERSNGCALPARLAEARAWLNKSQVAPAEVPFLTLRNGMGTLVDALIAKLDPAALRPRSKIAAVEPGRGSRRWSVFANGERVDADAVVLATPAHVAARLLPHGDLADELARIRYASTATVFFAAARELRAKLDGAGFIVPPGEGNLLAATWVSSKWPGRAPDGSALIRVFLGGTRGDVDVDHESDSSLAAIARFELERLIGPIGPARLTRVYRHAASNPQPTLGHGARLSRIELAQAAQPGLHLAGAAYHGVSIADCIRQARVTADAVAAGTA